MFGSSGKDTRLAGWWATYSYQLRWMSRSRTPQSRAGGDQTTVSIRATRDVFRPMFGYSLRENTILSSPFSTPAGRPSLWRHSPGPARKVRTVSVTLGMKASASGGHETATLTPASIGRGAREAEYGQAVVSSMLRVNGVKLKRRMPLTDMMSSCTASFGAAAGTYIRAIVWSLSALYMGGPMRGPRCPSHWSTCLTTTNGAINAATTSFADLFSGQKRTTASKYAGRSSKLCRRCMGQRRLASASTSSNGVSADQWQLWKLIAATTPAATSLGNEFAATSTLRTLHLSKAFARSMPATTSRWFSERSSCTKDVFTCNASAIRLPPAPPRRFLLRMSCRRLVFV
mmetsp:Transcript_49344/g.138188  ORF Transcript_49344/g.138188 Transcript_49344/m.138188 type:complete len:344 (-) Transcript_49344:505-1536(-)